MEMVTCFGSVLTSLWLLSVMVILGRLMLRMLFLSVWRLLLAPMLGEGLALGGEFSLAEGEVPLADVPDVWSDGSLVLDGSSGNGVAGCGPWPDGAGEACRLYCSIVLALSRLCSGLRFGEFWLPCRVVFWCMLVWITLTWFIMSLVLLLVSVLASLFL